MAATGLLGINPYYKGAAIDVSKPVNLAIQLEQKERELQIHKEQIAQQNKQIEKLMGKLEINGSFNTTINNNIDRRG